MTPRRSIERRLVAVAALAAVVTAGGVVRPHAAAGAAKPKRPDLLVSKASGGGVVAPGARFELAWALANRGAAAASKSKTAILLSRDAKADGSDVRLGLVAESALKARRTVKRTLSLKVPAATAPGTYSLLVCVDQVRKLRESNESNNCRRAGTLTVPGASGSVLLPPAPLQTSPTSPLTPPTPSPDRTPPETTITQRPPATTSSSSAHFAFESSEPGSTFECRLDLAAFAPCTSPVDLSGLLAAEHSFQVRATDAAGNRDESAAAATWRIAFEAPAPGPTDAPAKDPVTQAPPSKVGQMTVVADTTAFLYSGVDPIQKQVAPGAIDHDRASVLRGRVLRRDGSPIGGVRVTVLDHPELGRTATRDDGGYELAVNGGGTVVIEYEREGYVPGQRTLDTDALEFDAVDEIVLVPYADEVAGVDLTPGAGIQVAQSAPVTDRDGTRQATLLLDPDTDATARLPDGSTKPLPDKLNIRATEYTIGASGPAAMPGDLPPTSAYTYAVDYSVDEASKDGAVQVDFDKPVVTYVDNYLGFSAGTAVPMGYYDREKGEWVAAPDGVVIDVVGVSAGKAQLDLDGDGKADTGAKLTALGIDDAELIKLGQLYSAGDSLWRAAISHFTPWDYNWPYGLGPGATAPGQPGPSSGDGPGDGGCKKSGSTILCDDQVLGEQAPITGTPYTLHYISDRVPGRRADDALEIPLTGATVPATLSRVDLTIEVAGRTIQESFQPAPNLSKAFVFDGKDAYGRPVQGRQVVDVKLDYVYPAVYREPGSFQASFASLGGASISGNRTRQEISVSQTWKGKVGGIEAPPGALAGWSVDVHHAYDPVGRTLYLGNGDSRSAEGQNFDVISTLATGFSFPEGMAREAGGNLLVADSAAHVVRRVTPSGEKSVVAGTGVAGFSGDGGPAAQAQLNHPSDVAVTADGTVLIADEGNNRIRRLATDGTIATIAGTGAGGYAGDGGPAIAAELDEPSDVATTADGSLYVIDRANHALRRIGPDGVVTTVAGNGTPGFAGDGGVATSAKLHSPRDVAVREDGAVFIADGGNHRVRRIDPSGVIQTVAGDGADAYRGDGGKATEASLDTPSAVVPLPDGGFLIADAGSAVLRKVSPDGLIATVGGTGTPGFRGDGGPAAQARIDFPQAVVATPDDAVYLVDAGNDSIRKLAPSLPGLQLGEFTIPSDDGLQMYVFDRSGRHLRTRDSLTGAVMISFGYDQAGRLTSITDGDGNTTTINRSGGVPTSIVGPYGHTTTLQVDGNGYLSRIQGPLGNRILMDYAAGGLLTRLTDPRDGMHDFTYDSLGRLTSDSAPGTAPQTLTRSVQGSATIVERRSAEGRKTVYRSERLGDGSLKRTVVDPAGADSTSIERLDGSVTIKRATGDETTYVLGPDPRFGMQAPISTRMSITTPAGHTRTAEVSRTVELSNPSNPLSIVRWTETDAVNGRASTTTYEAATSRMIMRSPSGSPSTFTVDDQRRPVKAEMPGLATTTWTYDPRGRVTTRKQGPRTWSFSYGSSPQPTSQTDPSGRTTNYVYDAGNRVASRTTPGNRTVTYGYDEAGNVTSLTPPGTPAHVFTFNAHQDVSSYLPPPVGPAAATTFSYDADDEVTGIGRPGRPIAFVRDPGGRVTQITDGTRTSSFSYVGNTGRRATVTAGGETVSQTYDGSHPVTDTLSGVVEATLARTYDDEMRLTATTVNGSNSAGLAYDVDGLVTQVGAMSVARNPDNKLVSGTTLGSVASTITRNQFGGIDSETYMAGGTIYATDLRRETSGRLTSETTTTAAGAVTRTYAYDEAGRLQSATTGSAQTTYTYDASGNRLARTDPGGTTTGAYDAQDRLTRWGGVNYAYSPAGDLSSKTDTATNKVTSYEYDGDGNLLKAELPNGEKLDYVVDGLARRVAIKRDGTVERRYVYGEAQGPSAELDGGGSVVKRFVYGTRSWVPDYMVRNGTTYRFVLDARGSVRLVVDASNGNVAQAITYDEYGRILSDSSPGFQPFGFAGGLYDRDTGLVRLGRRDYDPETGRFTTRDPMGFNGGDSNLYAYTVGDPVNLTDADGQFLPLAGLAVIGGGLIGGVTSAVSAWAGGCDISNAFVSGAVGGAVGTAVSLVPGLGPLLGGAAGGMAGSLVSQSTTNLMDGDPSTHWNDYDVYQTTIDTASGGVFGKWGHPFQGNGIQPNIWATRGKSLGGRLPWGPNSTSYMVDGAASNASSGVAGGAYGAAKSRVCGC